MALRSGYSDLDHAGTAAKYVQRLDAVAASPFWREIKDCLVALLELRPGDHVLDVGCGTGDDVRTLARVVGPTGRAVGVDKSAAMIAEATRRSDDLGAPTEFHQADAHALYFPTGSFDACRVERVLQHMAEPQRAFLEMARVLRAGGRLAAVEPDYGTLRVLGADPELSERILKVRRSHFASPRIGAQLILLLKRYGFGKPVVQLRMLATTSLSNAELLVLRKYAEGAVIAGAIADSEAERWLVELEGAANRGAYRHAVAVYVVAGSKA